MPDWRWTAFVVVTLWLAYISRKPLLRPRSHGFFRFFAWEAIVGLVLLQVPVWFANPFSAHQVLSWILLIASLLPLVLGAQALKRAGRADGIERSEPELMGFERTGKLIGQGVFRHIRHPLYCSLLLLAGGAFLKSPSLASGFLTVVAAVMLLLAARVEERECIAAFGADYRIYMSRTKMFIPYVL
jgi:protein-S-isoprenylcysteine O-methyltransferase Ste14